MCNNKYQLIFDLFEMNSVLIEKGYRVSWLQFQNLKEAIWNLESWSEEELEDHKLRLEEKLLSYV